MCMNQLPQSQLVRGSLLSAIATTVHHCTVAGWLAESMLFAFGLLHAPCLLVCTFHGYPGLYTMCLACNKSTTSAVQRTQHTHLHATHHLSQKSTPTRHQVMPLLVIITSSRKKPSMERCVSTKGVHSAAAPRTIQGACGAPRLWGNMRKPAG